MIVVLGTIGLILLAVAAWFLVPFLVRKFAEQELQELCTKSRAIVLTYDDGPGEHVTPRLLDLLDREGVKATFYALGRNASARPHLVRRLISEGHDLGSHTYDHSNAWKTSPLVASMDIARGAELISKVGGHSRLFRPPFGKMTLQTYLQCRRRGFQLGWWTIDSRDSWQRRSISDVVAEVDAKGGGIVLMHDYDHYEKAPATPPHVEYALALAEAIIELARKRNYRIVPMTALEALEGSKPAA